MNSRASSDIGSAFYGRRVVVTGGAGFIGGHLGHALVSAGARVTVLDDLSSGSPGNLPEGIDFVQGSVQDESLLRIVFQGCSHVFHLAAMVSVPTSVADPDGCFERNVFGTEAVLRSAAREGVEGIVHTSSAAVYGSQPSLPSRETDPIQCESPYAASKACGEFLVQSAARCGRVPGASLRLFNVFGPRQNPDSPYAAVVCSFVEAAVGGRPIRIFGDGSQTRDFIPVREVVNAFMLAGVRAAALRGECFNVGLGVRTSVADLARMIGGSAGSESRPQYHPSRAGDVQHSCACLERSRRMLGFNPGASLEESLGELVLERKSRLPLGS